MSVDYCAGLAKGYKITSEQLNRASKLFEEEYRVADEDINFTEHYEGILICLNSYTEDSDYILGYCYCYDSECTGEYVNKGCQPTVDELNKLERIYYKYFDNSKEQKPQDIVYLRIW